MISECNGLRSCQWSRSCLAAAQGRVTGSTLRVSADTRSRTWNQHSSFVSSGRLLAVGLQRRRPGGAKPVNKFAVRSLRIAVRRNAARKAEPASRTFRMDAASFFIRPAQTGGKVRSHLYASLVEALYSHSSRGPGRRRSGQSQVSAPRRLHSPARGGHLQLSLSRPAVAEQDHRHRARGDGQDRAGVLSAGDFSARAVGGERPLERSWATTCSG